MFPTEKVNGSGIYDIDQQRHLPQMEIQEKLGVMQFKILFTSSYQLSYNQILRTACASVLHLYLRTDLP